MAKDSKIIAEYTIDVSKAEKQLAELEATVSTFKAIQSALNEPVNIEINVQYLSKCNNKNKWYQFWK
jgi:hypothetical protein